MQEKHLYMERMRKMECFQLGFICDEKTESAEIYDCYPEFEEMHILELRQLASSVLIQRNVFSLEKMIGQTQSLTMPRCVTSIIWQYLYYHPYNYFQFDVWTRERGKKKLNLN